MIIAEKELKEGKRVIEKTESKRKKFEEIIEDLNPDEVLITGCGSSYKVSMVIASEMKDSKISARAIEASEIIFSNQNIDEDTLVIGISQSGETSETVKALEKANTKKADTLSIVNNKQSTLSKVADTSILTPAGQEEAVLATKSVDSALRAGLILRDIFVDEETNSVELGDSLEQDISRVIEALERSDKAYCLGIGSFQGLAGEAATKLGEGPLIHANYMTSLEFSHGPKSHAKDMPVIILAMQPDLEEIYREFLEELDDTGAYSIVISPNSIDYSSESDLELSISGGIFSCLKVIQRIAVETAEAKGFDPDNPPNLSKHVEKETLNDQSN